MKKLVTTGVYETTTTPFLSKKLEGEGGGVTGEVWNLLRNGNSREYEKIAFNFGISDLRGMLKRLNNTKKNNKKNQSKFTFLTKYLICISNQKIAHTFN